MSGFEFHPFLQPHEIPNKKISETSKQEVVLDEHIDEKRASNFFQPHDQRRLLITKPFNKSGIVSYKEIPSAKEEEKQSSNIINFPKNHRLFDTEGKLKFSDNPSLRDNTEFHIKAQAQAKAEENKRIFKSANIENITKFLLDDKVIDFEFAKEIEKTKNEYASKLANATFLNQKHWKLLTGLRLFSKETFEHSVGTFLILKEKIKRLPKLEKEIVGEGVTIEQFLWSGLSHDVGKMAIPDFVLNNKTTDHDWAIGLAMLDDEEKDEIFIKIFEDKGFAIPDNARHDPNALAQILEEKRIRAVEYVPIKTILTQEQIQKMEEFGIDANLPLKKIMEIHEKKSLEILKEMGFVVEAMLAGNHHNYNYKDKKLGEKPTSLSALHIGIEISSTIIHLADVQHALTGDRSYHHKQPMLRILAFLVDDAQRGKILPGLTAAWIRDELSKMSRAYIEEVRTMSAKHQDQNYLKQRKEELELIEDFLEDNLDEEISGEFPSPIDNASKNMHADNYENDYFKKAI